MRRSDIMERDLLSEIILVASGVAIFLPLLLIVVVFLEGALGHGR